MIALALKWLSRAMFALAVFAALTAIYMFYTLNFGSCAEGGPSCNTNLATLYAAGIGIVGFSVSAYAANVISKGFDDSGDA
ncbi:MAG: hypothetical protein NXH78_00120 [Hyphomonadaceae bacterium]|nr:hypothetical protein [Hyphomonadaceae bacterium]